MFAGDSVPTLKTISLFGMNVFTWLPFSIQLPPVTGHADLTCEPSPRPVLPLKGLTPTYKSLYRGQDGESLACLYQLQNHEVLRFPAVADFRLDLNRIDVHIPASGEDLVELRLLGPVLSYWLERRGLPTLHASAVAVDGRAVAFLSNRGGGKTGLAAAFLQAGFPLLTDDVLPVEEVNGTFLARPGYPQMRMWPDEAAHFLSGWESLPLVHSSVSKRRVQVGPIGETTGFGTFHDVSLPLSGLYIPERIPEGSVEIQAVSPRDALIELVRHSFSPHLVQAAGLQPRRLDLLARLVMQVPVRRLRYPSGFERLPEAVDEVLRRSGPPL